MVGIQNGSIVLNFGDAMAEYLTHAYLMQYPMPLFRLDERNPTSYHLGKKLFLHYSMEANRSRGTHNILSVKKLLEAAPDIPDHEEVMRGNRYLDKRIITPFKMPWIHFLIF